MLTPEEVQQYRTKYQIDPRNVSAPSNEPLRGQALLAKLKGSAPVEAPKDEPTSGVTNEGIEQASGQAKAVVGGAAEGLGAGLVTGGINLLKKAFTPDVRKSIIDTFHGDGTYEKNKAAFDSSFENFDATKSFEQMFGKNKHPDAFKAGETAGIVGSVAAPIAAGAKALGVTDKLIEGANALKIGAKEIAETKLSKELKEDALKKVTPDYDNLSDAQKRKLINETVGDVPRVQEGGFMKGRKVTPTEFEIEAADELARVPGYKSGMSALETHSLVNKEIKATAEGLEQSLKDEKIIIPKKEMVSKVKGALAKMQEESLLLRKTDPAIAQYTDVVQKAAAQQDGTLYGLLKTRQAMDDAYLKVKKKFPEGGDTIAAIDEVHEAGRNALNQLLIDSAQSTEVKNILRKEWNLFRAEKELNTKASKESGSTLQKAGKFMKDHPLITAGAGSVVGAPLVNEIFK